jgi:cytochrome oxidase assembly protein ShyY1
MKIGSRTFAPRPFTTALTLVLMVALISLGRWQLRRAEQKRALYDEFDSGGVSPR